VVRDGTILLGPALAILEVHSIARGYVVLDATSKRAEIEVLRAEPTTPGKFWIAIAGGEAEVDEALNAGIDAAAESRIDHTMLPNVHPAVRAAMARDAVVTARIDSVGALELGSIAATVRAADAALKAADVALAGMHLARGIGGKGYVILTGALPAVLAALEAGAAAGGEAWVIGREVIPNPDRATATATGR